MHKYTLSDFDFDLPESLIAKYPCKNRIESRLLVVKNNPNSFCDEVFSKIIDYFKKDDVIVLNNTKVIPARLHGSKITGGKVEVFVERIQSEKSALCMIKSNKSPKVDSIVFFDETKATIKSRNEQFYNIDLLDDNWFNLLDKKGDIPLPPYINREAEKEDTERYQTVYAAAPGAVAAPTAGLHFDKNLLKMLEDKGVKIVYITLHVGAGTFLPVKTEDIDEHKMHSELFYISDNNAKIINNAVRKKGNITAVGTTSLRALESAYCKDTKKVKTGWQETNIFIRPGFSFSVATRLLTNFHLPRSTLMMLVSAFSGYKTIRETYLYAIDKSYRFFSYGDAMLLTKKN